LVLAVACAAALGLPAPASAQSGLPARPNYRLGQSPTPPLEIGIGFTSRSGSLFLLSPRYEAERRSRADEVRAGLGQLQQGQSQIEQQLNQLRNEDLDAYLSQNGTLLGRRPATFGDTRGAFPEL